MVIKEKVPVDPAAVLQLVSDATASLQAQLTAEDYEALQKNTHDERALAVYSADEREEALSDFEMLTAAEALGTLAGQIEAMVQQKMEQAYQQALRIYYTAEELARDPAHADLIPHVETMRKAHEAQYGKPIPKKQ